MNAHRQFDMSYIATTLAPLFERVTELGSAGLVEAVNCEALSPRVQALYLKAARERMLQVRAAADALLAKLPQVDELIEEQAMEGAA